MGSHHHMKRLMSLLAPFFTILSWFGVSDPRDMDRVATPSTENARLRRALLVTATLLYLALPACDGSRETDTASQMRQPDELIFFNFPEDTPQPILDAFEDEFGAKVVYESFQSPEEAAERLRGGMVCDVILIENQMIRPLAEEGLLLPLNLSNIPNFRNVSSNFRDLAFDPRNRHSVPADYGTAGMLVRTDLVGDGLTKWADLWDADFPGKIAFRNQPREIIGMTLLSLNFPLNSEDPQEHSLALKRLLVLRPSIVMTDLEASKSLPRLLDGEVVVLHGYSSDYQIAREINPAVRYILPHEGSALWGDSYVISSKTANPRMAENFINFMMRPEIAAAIVNKKGYASANEPAAQFIKPEILGDPAVYPPEEVLRQVNIIQSLTPQGEALFAATWNKFLNAMDTEK
jgi:spermidine/putrescine-binding protein